MRRSMRNFLTCCFALALLSVCTSIAQTVTTETRTTVDSATGKSVTTYSTVVSESEDVTPYNNVITLDPLKLLFYWNLSYYRAISKSIVLGVGIQAPTGFINLGSDNVNISGFGGKFELRWHPGGRAVRGMYIAPNVVFNSLSAEVTTEGSTDGGSATTVTVGALIGWQWLVGDEFAMGLGLGVDKYFLSVSDDKDISNFEGFEGIFPALRFDIGYAW
jgi:hypothetical protein